MTTVRAKFRPSIQFRPHKVWRLLVAVSPLIETEVPSPFTYQPGYWTDGKNEQLQDRALKYAGIYEDVADRGIAVHVGVLTSALLT